jgi:hypothetical protein
VSTIDHDRHELQVTRFRLVDAELINDSFRLLVRRVEHNGEGWLILNEEDAMLNGRYAFAIGRRRGADQVVLWFMNPASDHFAQLIHDRALPGRVLDKTEAGKSRFAGPAEVRIVLENPSDAQLALMIDRRSELFDPDPLVFTRLRRLP